MTAVLLTLIAVSFLLSFFLTLATQLASAGSNCAVWSSLNWKSCPCVKAVIVLALRNCVISAELIGMGTRTNFSPIGTP